MPIYKTDKKKDGKQQYRVRVSFTDGFGKARQIERTAYGLAEAKQIEAEIRKTAKESPQFTSMTINDLSKEYLSAKKHDVRESSLDKTRRILEYYVLPKVGEIKLKKLNRAVLQRWKDEIGETDIAIKTKQNVFGEFRGMLNYAVRMEYIAGNPLTVIGNFKEVYFKTAEDKLHYYTAEQFKLYIRAAKENAEKINTLTEWGYYVFFNIAFYTGMRKGEINALKWSDLEGNIIHVRRSVAQKIKGKDIVETPPKNKSSYRSLQAPAPLMIILNEHKLKQQRESRFTEDFRICGGIACLRDSSLSNKNKQFATAAGLPHIRIHDFRHTHASLLVNEGINIQEIARRLGHSQIEMTWNTYSHLYPREEERALDVLNRIT